MTPEIMAKAVKLHLKEQNKQFKEVLSFHFLFIFQRWRKLVKITCKEVKRRKIKSPRR